MSHKLSIHKKNILYDPPQLNEIIFVSDKAVVKQEYSWEQGPMMYRMLDKEQKDRPHVIYIELDFLKV